jgi:hypothetical protein
MFRRASTAAWRGVLVLYDDNATDGRLSTRKRPPRFSYLDDFFGTRATTRGDHPATDANTARIGMEMMSQFALLGLTLHPTKCGFTGARLLETLGILMDTSRA